MHVTSASGTDVYLCIGSIQISADCDTEVITAACAPTGLCSATAVFQCAASTGSGLEVGAFDGASLYVSCGSDSIAAKSISKEIADIGIAISANNVAGLYA